VTAMPEAYRAIVDRLIVAARQILERGESLVPFAFVGNLTTKETQPVMLGTGRVEQKDESAHLIRHLAHRLDADFVFVIMDAWSLPPEKIRRYQEIIERYGSIGASPYRIDVVSLTLETRHGLWAAQVPVKPKGVSKKKRTFGAPTFQHFTEAGGRFVDLLPVKDSDGEATGTLH